MGVSEFAKLTQDEFEFLISEYNFRCVEATNYYVRFESEKVLVIVHYDASMSYELDVEFGQLGVLFNGNERPFNLGEILRLYGVAEKENYTFFQACNSGTLSNCVARLASLVSTYAVELLQNTELSFRRLANLREGECNQYELETKLAHIRRAVQIAWKKKDYLKVAELYKPVEGFISEAEKKKLNFARKRIK